MNKKQLDWSSFILSISFILAMCLIIFLYPKQTDIWLQNVHDHLMNQVGILYLWAGFSSLLFLLWVAFSKYGKIKLGPKHAKPTFSTFSWIALVFCAGIGAGVIYWGTIEWAFYYMEPPFSLAQGSIEAIEWSAAYGMFHTGPTAWAIYCLPAIPIAYIYHVKGKPVLKISEACRPILKHHSDGVIGKIIDLAFIIGLLGSSGTTLGISIPMIAAGVHKLTGLEHTYTLDILILFVCTLLFSISVYSGLEKGIKKLSDINIYLAISLLLFVFLAGPTIFILEMSTNSIGLVSTNLLRLNTWIDPIGQSGFPEKWTLFFWAWWIVYAPFIGLFIAKISRGRTIKQVILGTIGFGTVGCWLFFTILGNFSLYKQLNGSLPVVELLAINGAPETIVTILSTLPLGELAVLLFTLLSIVFLSTTFDTSSYMLAAVTQKNVHGDPIRWNRLFWAFALALPPAALMFIGGLNALQTVTLIVALPSVFIIGLLVFSFLKLMESENPR
ncbi:BCCT family transporter [Aquibacillus albus]|uniref:BCCT family betaine/carnitine transporter n=1 Tax=Aquibacillus albus TaxID=1168171 RepID=A0ABS2MXQ6_9BACI|nr:BCCT family transporter [Aquibacillus albus]MBM7570671.1 BCCT family betaine/carnitine transporter [Aquibacillus albus]